MNTLLSLIAPLILCGVVLYAAAKDIDAFSAMVDGSRQGLQTLLRIAPALICFFPAVSMLRASGALDLFAQFCTPLLDLLRIPPETVPLLFLRPISGSGALSVGSELLTQYGPDSLIGRTVSVMLGSTETTFYVIAVYFGAAGIRKTRHAIPAALAADLAAFAAASLTVRLFWG